MAKQAVKTKKKSDKEAYLMILPAYLIFAVFILIPIGMVLYYSLTDFNMYAVPKFLGIKNYVKLFSDSEFLRAITNTLFYTVVTLTVQLALGLLLAVLLYRKSKAVPIFRTALYLPNVMSMVCVSMVWLWLYNPNFGIFNRLLEVIGIAPQKWLINPSQAMLCIILVGIWKNCGYSMVIFLGGLTGIPESLYEAAQLDGAGPIRRFLNITWPMLRPTTFFLVVTGIVNSFAVFEQVNILTSGGPLNRTTTVVHQIYRRGFLEFKMGYASAMAVLLLAFSLIVTMLVFKFGNKGQDIDVS